jgi:hypothetical protein
MDVKIAPALARRVFMFIQSTPRLIRVIFKWPILIIDFKSDELDLTIFSHDLASDINKPTIRRIGMPRLTLILEDPK